MDTPAPIRPVGRPKGEASTVINLRLSVALLEQIDRYCDRVSTRNRSPVNRATITRQALGEFLAQHAPDLL